MPNAAQSARRMRPSNCTPGPERGCSLALILIRCHESLWRIRRVTAAEGHHQRHRGHRPYLAHPAHSWNNFHKLGCSCTERKASASDSGYGSMAWSRHSSCNTRAHTQIDMCIHMHTYTHTHIYIYIYVYIYIHAHANAHTHAHTHTHTHLIHIDVRTHTHACTCTYVCVCIYTYVGEHMHVHVYEQIHIHIHRQRHDPYINHTCTRTDTIHNIICVYI